MIKKPPAGQDLRFKFYPKCRPQGKTITKKNMRLRLIFVSLILVYCIDVFPQAKPVKEIAPGVFYYFGDEAKQMSANCVWIVFREFVLAIDANYPWGAEDILKEIRKTTDKPVRYVFNTHYHHDHTFGNAVFKDS